MRICFSTKQEGVEGAQEGQNNDADAARGILSNLLKRNLCENIVPVLIQLKDLMERKFSPFLRQLRHCLREILRDFKDDLKDILAGDAQLASEIAFDLEKEQDAPQGESPKKKMPKNPLATRRESLGKMMAPDAVTPGGTPPNTPAIQDTEHRRRSSMGLPKARRSTGSPGTPGSVRGAAALDSVSLPVVQSQDDPSQHTADSPRQTRTPGSVRCTGASPAPSSAVRQRQAAIARAAQADSANADVPPQSIDFGVADALSTTTRMTAPDPNNLEPIAEDEPMAEVEALCAKAAGTPTQKGGKIIVGKENEGQKKKRGKPAKTSVAQ
jgi:condensin-2 complex subunit D3